MLARARALATHRDDHALLPLPVLALLIGVHVKTLRAAARDGRLPVTYDTTNHLSPPPGSRDSRRGQGVSAVVLWAHGSPSRSSRAIDVDQRAQGLRRADSRASSRARIEPSAIGHAGGRGAQSRRLPMGGAETHAVTAVLATNRRALPVNWARATHWRRSPPLAHAPGAPPLRAPLESSPVTCAPAPPRTRDAAGALLHGRSCRRARPETWCAHCDVIAPLAKAPRPITSSLNSGSLITQSTVVIGEPTGETTTARHDRIC